MSNSVLVIGAGAAGLIAARHLSAAGCSVTLLEAEALPGGRTATRSIAGFSMKVELGAEFIHGDLPISLELAKAAGITLHPVNSHMASLQTDESSGHENEEWQNSEGWDELIQQMGQLEQDMPVADFLTTFFQGDRNAELRDRVERYAEGYDLADLHTVSTKALYKEWSSEEDDEGYRPEGGYQRLIDLLVAECERNGVQFHYSMPVTGIRWQQGRVEAIAAGGQQFTADRLLVTVSLGMLPHLAFQPDIPAYLDAARQIGFGTVVKVLLEFRTPFWQQYRKPGQTLFLLSDQPVPTWWTQADDTSNLLTGWLPGRKRAVFDNLDAEGRIDLCLDSLAAIFSIDRAVLQQELTASAIIDWQQSPYVQGGYSFDTVTTPQARTLLCTPLAGTLYFAGEALYTGDYPGTVEAAFHNGLAVAEKIIADQAN